MPEIRVAIILGRNPYFNREILRGISRFVAGEQSWYCQVTTVFPDSRETLKEWRPDAVISQASYSGEVDLVKEINKPTVNVANVLNRELPWPRVGFREESIGATVAEHFMERDLKCFGFVGFAGHAYSIQREQGFRDALDKSGYECSIHHLVEPHAVLGGRWGTREVALQEWLASLPKPAGIMVAADTFGIVVAHVCRELGYRVPEEISIVGVDDDMVMCELAKPPLSSVGLPIRRAGMEAASLLAGLIAGDPPPTKPVLLPHSGLVLRQSSDRFAIPDPEVAQAASFIRNNAHQGVLVEDVLAKTSVGRRTLERRFRKHMGHSVLDEIRRARIERAKRLLAVSDMPISAVATSSGFSNMERFAAVFRQQTGMTPSAYRRQFSC